MADGWLETKAAVDGIQKAWHEYIDVHKTEIEEIKKLGHAFPETTDKLNRLNERMDDFEIKLNRVHIPETDPDAVPVGLSAFTKHLRYANDKAFHVMTEDEKESYLKTKSLSVQDDQTVGLLAPEDFRANIIKRIPNISGLADLVRRESTARDTLRYPRLTHTLSDATGALLGTTDIATSGLGVTWEDEFSPATETDFSLGQVQVNMYKMRCLVRVGRELLEDAAVNVVDFLAGLFAERFAIEIDRVITRGQGGRQPEGFLNNTGIPTVLSGSGGANNFTYNGLIDTWSSLPAQYAKNAKWMTKRSSLGELRKLKDAVGDPLWQPALTADMPSTIMGHGIITNEHMPAPLVANAKAMAFADWQTLYLLVLKTGMSVQRLDEAYASTDEVGFICRQRIGGKVIGEWAARYNIMS